MQYAPYRALLFTLPVLLLLSGCFYSREIASTQRAIAAQNPDVDFDRQITFSAGPNTIDVFAGLASYVRIDDVLRGSDYLRMLRRVKVGIYQIESDVDTPLVLRAIPQLRRGGWQTVARFRGDDGESVAVLYRERYGEIRDLYVLALMRPELVIVRATGNFTDLIIDALSDFADRIPRLNGDADDGDDGDADASGDAEGE